MAWIKNSTSLAVFSLIVFSLLLVFITDASARKARKGSDAMWSVVNKEKAEVVPSYTGGESPFPVNVVVHKKTKLKFKGSKKGQYKRKKIVRKKIIRKKIVRKKLDEKSKKEIKEEKIAMLIKKIHEALNNKKAYSMDIDSISVEGVINSTFGKKVLINNKWFALGENISVNILQADTITDLVAQLETLDKDIAKIVEEDLTNKMEDFEGASLILTKIDKDFIELKDNFGKKHVISFVVNSL